MNTYSDAFKEMGDNVVKFFGGVRNNIEKYGWDKDRSEGILGIDSVTFTNYIDCFPPKGNFVDK